MYKTAKESLKEETMVSIQDFAENFRSIYQNEIASAHFSYEQVTLLTQVSCYHCPTCPDLVEESIVFISADTSHSTGFINACMEMYHNDLQQSGVDIKHEIVFSDGCAAQFKSKKPFTYVSVPQCGHTIQREFFASGHGKSSCDALGGLVKRTATNHIAALNVVVKGAMDLYEFAKDKLTEDSDCSSGSGSHKSRRFFYVDYEESDTPILPCTEEKLRRVPATRKLHSIRGGGEGLVFYRLHSCFCGPCVEGHPDDCENPFAGRYMHM